MLALIRNEWYGGRCSGYSRLYCALHIAKLIFK